MTTLAESQRTFQKNLLLIQQAFDTNRQQLEQLRLLLMQSPLASFDISNNHPLPYQAQSKNMTNCSEDTGAYGYG